MYSPWPQEEAGDVGEQEPLVPYVDVEFLDLTPGKIFDKKQFRKNHKTRQLVLDKGHGLIRMRAKTNSQLLNIRGWVKRDERAAVMMGDLNGEVPIKNEDTGEILNLIKDTDKQTVSKDGYILQPFSVDLHEIYNGNFPDKPVFELAKSDSDQKQNIFKLVIELEFIDGTLSTKFYSPIFNLRTEKKEKVAKKRKHQDDGGIDHIGVPANFEESGVFDVFDVSGRQRKILVDMLDAKTARVDKLEANVLQVSTKQADLAYHMTLKEPENYDDLEEGDIIGFYEDEESGETYIQRLRSDNIQNALHAGVVSRSYWLDGNKPLNPETKTDTICVIGIVNVKVVGSIENGERIYASPNNPGKAIPQSHMPVGSFLRKKHVLLGMAMETKKNTKTFDDIQLVKCFVCIVLDVSRQELLQEIEDLYEVNEKRTEEKIKISNKRNWKRLKRYCVSAILILGVIIFMLYQWLVPGSMFRYWRCRQGSIPDHDLCFDFKQTSSEKMCSVRGIKFTMRGLQNKVGINKLPPHKFSNVSYYLNVDLCAYYWADGPAGNNIGGRKIIGGPKIIMVKNFTNGYRLPHVVNGEKNWTKLDKIATINKC